MQNDPKQKEQQVDSTGNRDDIQPLDAEQSQAKDESVDDNNDEGYVVVESGLGIDE